MTAYMIVQTVKEGTPEGVQAYREAATELIMAAGVKPLAAGQGEVVEGNWGDHPFTVLEFPNLEGLQEYYHSGAYQAAKKLRDDAGQQSNILIIDGLNL